jgi:hypothetical protein
MNLTCVSLLPFSSIVNKNVNLQSFFLLLIPISNRFHYCATQKERQIVMSLYPMPMHIIEIFESGKKIGVILGKGSCKHSQLKVQRIIALRWLQQHL